MPITYPLQPTLSNIANVDITLRRVTGVSESPFTFQQQVYEHQGARWELNVTFAPMTRAQAATLHGFLASLRGRRGTFLLSADPLAETPVSGGTDGNLSGSYAARATTIVTQATETWVAGDWIQIGNHLHKIVQRNSGTNYDIEPGLRQAYTNGTVIDATDPKGIWRLASDDFTYSINRSRFYQTTIACVEAL
jgi:hypothetical protein